MQEPQRFQAGDRRGVEVVPTLEVGEVGGDADDAVGDGGFEVLLGDLLEVGEEHGEDLGGGEGLGSEVDEDAAIGGGGGGEGKGSEVVLDGGVVELAA